MAGLERLLRQRCLLSEKNKNMTALLGFANMHMNKPHDFWNNFLLTDDTEVEMFGHNAAPDVWYTTHNISAQTSPSNCHAQCWRGVDLGFPCSHRTWALALIESNSSVYQSILEPNVSPFSKKLKQVQKVLLLKVVNTKPLKNGVYLVT